MNAKRRSAWVVSGVRRLPGMPRPFWTRSGLGAWSPCSTRRNVGSACVFGGGGGAKIGSKGRIVPVKRAKHTYLPILPSTASGHWSGQNGFTSFPGQWPLTVEGNGHHRPSTGEGIQAGVQKSAWGMEPITLLWRASTVGYLRLPCPLDGGRHITTTLSLWGRTEAKKWGPKIWHCGKHTYKRPTWQTQQLHVAGAGCDHNRAGYYVKYAQICVTSASNYAWESLNWDWPSDSFRG